MLGRTRKKNFQKIRVKFKVATLLSLILKINKDNTMSKKQEYIKQWIKSHPQIRIYLSKEEYETFKKLLIRTYLL